MIHGPSVIAVVRLQPRARRDDDLAIQRIRCLGFDEGVEGVGPRGVARLTCGAVEDLEIDRRAERLPSSDRTPRPRSKNGSLQRPDSSRPDGRNAMRPFAGRRLCLVPCRW